MSFASPFADVVEAELGTIPEAHAAIVVHDYIESALRGGAPFVTFYELLNGRLGDLRTVMSALHILCASDLGDYRVFGFRVQDGVMHRITDDQLNDALENGNGLVGLSIAVERRDQDAPRAFKLAS